MISRSTVLFTILVLTLLYAACGQSDNKTDDVGPADLMPDDLSTPAIVKSTETDTFVGQALWELINGGAELYHLYGFVDVASSLYEKSDREIQIDIFRFKDSDAAYGLYAALRPDRSHPVELGVDGFATSSSIDFVKGEFLVRVIGFDASVETATAVEALANNIESNMPGTTNRPAMFERFPQIEEVPSSGKIEAQSFLGFGFLTDVYTQLYVLDEDTVTLFITNDSSGDKFLQWSQQVSGDQPAITIDSIPFDQGAVLVTQDLYWGAIVAGVRGDYLLGMINYHNAQMTTLTDWLRTLP